MSTDSGIFRIVVLPDTQIYARDYPEIYAAQTRWIADNVGDLKIKMVLHAGDLVHNGAAVDAEWQCAKEAMDTLDSTGVPCVIAIGNHDYDDKARTRASVRFNQTFGMDRYRGKEWFAGSYEADVAENVVATIRHGEVEYVILCLEFGPRKSVVEWANQVVAEYAPRPVILLTHNYMDQGDSRNGPEHRYNPHAYGLGEDAHDGEELWEALVRRHANIILTVSGHILGTGVGRRADINDGGFRVHQMLANYQMKERGGDGFLRILTFHPANQSVCVSTYSPFVDQYKSDPENHFKLDIDYPL